MRYNAFFITYLIYISMIYYAYVMNVHFELLTVFVWLELHFLNVKPFWIKWTFIAWLDMLHFLFPPTLTLSGGTNSSFRHSSSLSVQICFQPP